MIECPDCSKEARPRARFCVECGHALFSACPNCAREITVWDAFCRNCGYRSQQASREQRGEVSRGTILFGSLEGIREMVEPLPPKLVSDVMTLLFDLLSEPVIRHDGSVNRYEGDEILAYFPTRRGRETNPVRAIEAGLAMQEALGQFAAERVAPVRMRVGVSTGLVLAAETGSRTPGQFTLIGSVVDLATSLGHEAQYAGILVDEETYRLAEHAFAFEEQPPLAMRGQLELITPFVPLPRRTASISL